VACRANCESWDAIYDRLAAYEDTGLEPEQVQDMMTDWVVWKEAEAGGRLIVLPCKVGQSVFVVQRNGISEFRITGYEYSGMNLWANWYLVDGLYGCFRVDGIPASRIGFDVFATREEAEAAMGGDGDG
jgi:hypothetical protein